MRDAAAGMDQAIDRYIDFIIFGLHAYFMFAMGSVLFVDASSYLKLSVMWDSLQDFRNVNGSSGLMWFYNYVPVALPLMWSLLERLPVWAIWPVLAGLQHLIAFFAIRFFLRRTKAAYRSTVFNYAAIFLCLLPFYQGCHNTLTTESLSSSIAIFGLGYVVTLMESEDFDRRSFLWILGLIFLSSFVRLTVGVLLFGFAAIAILRHAKLLSWRPVALATVLMISFAWYPLARGAVTGIVLFPKTGVNGLLFSFNMNLDVSEEAEAELLALDWPQSYDPTHLIVDNRRAGFGDMSRLASGMAREGKDIHTLMGIFDEAVSIVKYDDFKTQLRTAIMSASTIGVVPECYMPSRHMVERGAIATGSCLQKKRGYYNFGWLNTSANYFDRVMNIHFSVDSDDFRTFRKAWERYAAPDRPRFVKDPARLGGFPLEILIGLHFVASLMMLLRRFWLGVALIGAPLGWWFLHFLVPYGTVRYAHAIVPLYLLSFGIAWAMFAGRRSRHLSKAGWADGWLSNVPRLRTVSMAVLAGTVVLFGLVTLSQVPVYAAAKGWTGRNAAIQLEKCTLRIADRSVLYDEANCGTVTSDRPTYLIIGDSYAADAYMILSRAYQDHDFLLLSLPGHELKRFPNEAAIEDLDERRASRNYRMALEKLAAQPGLDGIILATDIGTDREGDILQIARERQTADKPVIIFGPRLQLPTSLDNYAWERLMPLGRQGRGVGAPNGIAERSNAFETRVRTGDTNIHYIDMLALQCDATCPLILRDGRKLLIDDRNLTVEGAGFYAAKLNQQRPGFFSQP